MPNLDFYAVGEDWTAVLETVFELGLFRVFEDASEPDHELREFHAATEIPGGRAGHYLRLLVIGAGPEPIVRRSELSPGALGDATFLYRCEGWGLVQLFHGVPNGTQELRLSHTNHNTEKRALGWSQTLSPKLGNPGAWDWRAITSASGRLNRVIRRMAVRRIGAHPVLPQAAHFIADAHLQYEYGRGIHATPAFGMTRR